MLSELADLLRRSSVEIRTGRRGVGSGIIWTSDGHIVTNAHVVGRGDAIVKLSDGREFRAETKSQNQKHDLALLKLEAHNLNAAAIGDSNNLLVGQLVAAMGNPLGIFGAITTGIIHATGGGKWIQADLRLAPGNSGGILADSRGRVIGINTMIYDGLALAIPSNTAAAFARGESIDHSLRNSSMRVRAA